MLSHVVLAKALALGLTTFALSFLPATTAQAECQWLKNKQCPEGWRQSRKETSGGGVMEFKDYRVLCCTTPSEPYATGGQKPPALPQGTPIDKIETDPKGGQQAKPIKKFGRSNTVCAKNDVDIFNSPVEPRNVIGMMNGGTKGTIVERHPDGWYKIQGYGWIASDHFGACP